MDQGRAGRGCEEISSCQVVSARVPCDHMARHETSIAHTACYRTTSATSFDAALTPAPFTATTRT